MDLPPQSSKLLGLQACTAVPKWELTLTCVSGALSLMHSPHDTIHLEALRLTQAGDPYVRCAPGSALHLTEAAASCLCCREGIESLCVECFALSTIKTRSKFFEQFFPQSVATARNPESADND